MAMARPATLLLTVYVAACSGERSPAAASTDARPRLIASIEELMDAQVDPSADGLWDAVAVVSTAQGTETRAPRTAEDWDATRHAALALAESMNLLVMPGRPVAGTHARARAPGELAAREIERHIADTPAAFAGFARALQMSAVRALDAIDAKDPAALMEAGTAIDGACEACHVAYWYPNLKPQGANAVK